MPPLPKPERKLKVTGPGGGFGVPSEEPLVKADERKVKLKNLQNRSVDITLEHEVYCKAIGRCVCAERDMVRFEQIERGSKEQAPRIRRKRLPKSLILAPLGESVPLNEAVKGCADVRSKLINRPQKLKVLPA